MAEPGSEPVRWWVLDGWIDPPGITVPSLEWDGWEARYENDTEHHKRTTRSIAAIPGLAPVFDRLRSLGAGGEWSRRLGYTVDDDPTMHGGGLHVTAPGGWLNTHLDYDRHPKLPHLRRALNLIVFLNPEWRPDWGGAFILCDPLGQVVKRVDPAPGRLLAFEVGDLSYHGVERVTGPAERVTAAVYYLSPAAASNTRQRALFLPTRGAM